jgi:hypothetical protein
MDELTKKKISMSMRGKKKSATHRKNISLSMRKLKMTKEHKEAIAEAMKISWIKRKESK